MAIGFKKLPTLQNWRHKRLNQFPNIFFEQKRKIIFFLILNNEAFTPINMIIFTPFEDFTIINFLHIQEMLAAKLPYIPIKVSPKKC